MLVRLNEESAVRPPELMLRPGDRSDPSVGAASPQRHSTGGGAVGDTNASAVVGQDSPERDDLRSATLVRHATADVGRSRETLRRKRLLTLVLVVGAPTAYLWYRILSGNPL